MIYFLFPIIITILLILGWIYFDNLNRKKFISRLSEFDKHSIIDKENTSKDITFELLQAGLTLKQYKEGSLMFSILGIVIIFVSYMLIYPSFSSILGFILGLICIFFSGKAYLFISKKERAEKIDKDLGIFLNLINVILEAGGGLKNALFQVSKKANGIIHEELLKEIAILEYEMTNYTTVEAYKNLKKRVNTSNVNKVADFLILSEETGIGVKSIFAIQGEEMRKEKLYKIKGKVNTLNMYLMLTIFIFILPAIGAMLILPIMAGKIQIGL